MKKYYRDPSGRIYVREESGFTVGAYDDDDDDDLEDEDLEGLLVFGEDLYGAAKKAKKRGDKGKMARLKAAALARAAGGFAFPSRGQGYGMRLPLPFEQAFTAGQTVTLQLKPQNRFRVEELIFQSPNAQLFNVLGFKVGTQDQFVGSDGPLNGDLISSQTLRSVSFKGTVADPGILISLAVQNLDTLNAQTLRGAIIGPAVRFGDAVA